MRRRGLIVALIAVLMSAAACPDDVPDDWDEAGCRAELADMGYTDQNFIDSICSG